MIEMRVGAGITVRFTEVLLIPEKDAMMVVFPTATPVAKPEAEMLATLLFMLIQVTWEVIFAVVLFE